MNREIKFRAWDSHEEKMYIQGNANDENRKVFWDIWENKIHISEPMQYTGLKDKNGKDIYEGDYNKDYEVVIWCERCTGWQFGLYDIPTKELIYCHNCEGNFMFQDISEFEITGNIYQNHELLTK